MKIKLSNQSGLTLIELIIGMSLTVLLMSGVVSLLSTSLQAYQVGTRKTEVQQTARFALDFITRELRYATNVVIDSNKSGITFNTSSQEDTIHIFTDGYGILRRQNTTAGGGQQPITGSNNVKISVAFTLDPQDNRTIGMTLTATDTYTDKLPRQSITLKTSVISLNVPPQ